MNLRPFEGLKRITAWVKETFTVNHPPNGHDQETKLTTKIGYQKRSLKQVTESTI